MRRNKNHSIRNAVLGWLEIEIIGVDAKRLLNLAIQQNIELNYIRYYGDTKIRANILLQDIYLLRSLARATSCRFKIKKRRGWPFIAVKMRRRSSFLVGGLIFLIAFALLFSIIWRIEVTSHEVITADQRAFIIALAEQSGLQIGAFSWQIDYDAVTEQMMLAAAAELIFVEIERHGITARIQVAWRLNIPQAEQALPPGEIIANAAGIIESLLVHSGTAAVEVGDTVQKGDILVYGYLGDNLVAASAIIEARIWGQGIGHWPLLEQGVHASGQTTKSWQLRFGRGAMASAVWLRGVQVASYPLFRHAEQVFIPVLWRNIELPVELVLHTWYEEHEYTTTYSEEQALYYAWQIARSRAVEQLPYLWQLQEELYTKAIIDDIVEVRVVIEAAATIGVFQALDTNRLQQYEEFLLQLQQEQNQEQVIQ
jgi:similar to stage IV sporulation protein